MQGLGADDGCGPGDFNRARCPTTSWADDLQVLPKELRGGRWRRLRTKRVFCYELLKVAFGILAGADKDAPAERWGLQGVALWTVTLTVFSAHEGRVYQ